MPLKILVQQQQLTLQQVAMYCILISILVCLSDRMIFTDYPLPLYVMYNVCRLLSRSRELAESPLRAAQAYEDTVMAINEAEQAAMAAVNASEAAFEKVSSDHRPQI